MTTKEQFQEIIDKLLDNKIEITLSRRDGKTIYDLNLQAKSHLHHRSCAPRRVRTDAELGLEPERKPMSKKQPCSALVPGHGKPGFIVLERCKHGHATTSPCYGISSDTLSPVCIQENRQFDERTKTVRLYHWHGA